MAGVCWSMDTVGPISRSAEDCALTFQAIAGHDPMDPYSWNAAVPDYAQEIQGGIDGMRVGVLREKVSEGGLAPEVRQVIESSVAQLGELGATVREVSIPIVENAGAVSKCITDMDGAAVHYERLKTRAAEYDHNTRVRLLTAILTPAQAYQRAQKVRTLIREAVLQALEEVDVIVLPTSPTVRPCCRQRRGSRAKRTPGAGLPECAISRARSTRRGCRHCQYPADSRPRQNREATCRCRCKSWGSR